MWTQILYAWLALSFFLTALFVAAMYQPEPWVADDDLFVPDEWVALFAAARFDGGDWVPEEWTA